MGKKVFSTQFMAILIVISTLRLGAQVEPSTKVEFLNAPVLFKEGAKSFQQVVASYRSDKPGKIIINSKGKELLKADLIRGNNRFLLTFPAVTKPGKIDLTAQIDDKPAGKYSFTFVPPRKWQIYFVQHSHTDMGYTRPQSEILAEHMRYIDYARISDCGRV